MNYSNGFTLAEVLITLVIIGIIAAMTIPTLIATYHKQETVSKLKKAYSTIAQTATRAVADYGSIEGWEIDDNFAEKYIIPYISVMHNCKNETTGVCSYKYSYLNSNSLLEGPNYRFYLPDGTFVGVTIYNYESMNRADIMIDINGQKSPNKLGHDAFLFRYVINRPGSLEQNGTFLPPQFIHARSTLMNNGTWGCNKNASGEYCSTVIMKDGWQIKDDYPW